MVGCPQVTGTAPVGAQEPMHQHPCGNAPDFARHGARVARAVSSVDVMMAGGPVTWEWKPRSVFVGKHDRDHTDRDSRVSRVGRVVVQAAVEIDPMQAATPSTAPPGWAGLESERIVPQPWEIEYDPADRRECVLRSD
jgi:hypothetical protein